MGGACLVTDGRRAACAKIVKKIYRGIKWNCGTLAEIRKTGSAPLQPLDQSELALPRFSQAYTSEESVKPIRK